jgi:hypothetical protein
MIAHQMGGASNGQGKDESQRAGEQSHGAGEEG